MDPMIMGFANRHNLLGSSVLSPLATEKHGELLDDHVTKLNTAIDAVDAAEKASKSNPNLSIPGRRAAIDMAKDDAAVNIGKVTANKLEALEQRKAGPKSSITMDGLNKPTDAPSELRAAEIRGYLRTRDQAVELPAELNAAADAGQSEIVAAALHDPFGKLVPKDQADALRDRWTKGKFPKAHEQLSAVDEAAGIVKSNCSTALNKIGRTPDQIVLKQ